MDVELQILAPFKARCSTDSFSNRATAVKLITTYFLRHEAMNVLNIYIKELSHQLQESPYQKSPR